LAAISDAQELLMKKAEYGVFEALNPFFEIVLGGLSGLVDGEHYFDTIADSAIFESRYHFPGWPMTIRGRANLMASLSGYGKTIKLHSGHALVVGLRIALNSESARHSPPINWRFSDGCSDRFAAPCHGARTADIYGDQCGHGNLNSKSIWHDSSDFGAKAELSI
jgi:hypothetical protein